MELIDTDTLAEIIKQAWEDDYPPELAPANVKGRKLWRKRHLVDLIVKEMPANFNFGRFEYSCGELE